MPPYNIINFYNFHHNRNHYHNNYLNNYRCHDYHNHWSCQMHTNWGWK